LKAKKLPVLIALIALIGTFTSVIPQQAFADGTDARPVECTLMGPDFRPLAIAATHTLTFTPVEADVVVTYTETLNGDPPSQLAVIVLDPGSGNAQFVPIAGGSATATFVGAADGQPHTVVVCAGMLATSKSLNTVMHTLSNYFDFPYITSSVCGDGFVDFGETCDDGNITDGDGCSSICQTEGTTVEMEVNVPPFCGLGFIDPVDGILTFPSTINFAVSLPRSVTLSNTGNGAGEVFISGSSVTHPTTTNLVGDWLDDNGGFLWEVFRTRFASADIDYTLMTSVFFIPQTFIEILDGQDQAERILKVRPFDQTGQDNVLGHQIMDLEIDCTPARSCLGGQLIFNGDCVDQCPVPFIPNAENRKCVLEFGG